MKNKLLLQWTPALGFTFPIYTINTPVFAGIIEDKKINVSDFKGKSIVFPLSLKFPNEEKYWEFPIEPIITIRGKNNIIRRNVSKSDGIGTIKELWNQDDYDITINGIIQGDNVFPEEDLRTLRIFCESQSALDVKCDLLAIFGINKIVIETFDFPYTAGADNQLFELKAYSDEDYELLIEDNQ